MSLESSLNYYLFAYLVALTKFSRFNWKITSPFSFLMLILLPYFLEISSFITCSKLDPSLGLPHTCIASVTWIHYFLAPFFFLALCLFCWHISPCDCVITDAVSNRLFVIFELISLSVWNELCENKIHFLTTQSVVFCYGSPSRLTQVPILASVYTTCETSKTVYIWCANAQFWGYSKYYKNKEVLYSHVKNKI